LKTAPKKAIFLDRDGVINQDIGYLHEIDKFKFIDGVFDLCKKFIKSNYLLIIVTNQSGIARGYYTVSDFNKLNNWMLKRFKENGITISAVYFCPHGPDDNCSCRKPKSGMILDAAVHHNIDLENSWLIGDKFRDIESAINGGIKNTIKIGLEKSDNDAIIPTYTLKSLSKISEIDGIF